MPKSNDYTEKLKVSSLLAMVIYAKDPKSTLESISKHNIEEIAVSKTDENGFAMKYMICSNKTNKQLYIVFSEGKQMKDFLTNFKLFGEIDNCKGSFHWSIFNKSFQIPIEFYVNKLLNDNYDLIFTGHGIGGAIASIVAARIMFHDKIIGKSEKCAKILSIGFGTPPFVDFEFKKFIDESNLNNNFYFYIDENDQVFNLLDTLLNVLSIDTNLLNNEDLKSELIYFMQNIIYSKDISEYNTTINGILASFRQLKARSYTLFGSLLNSKKLKTEFKLNQPKKFDSFSNIFDQHTMKFYFNSLNSSDLTYFSNLAKSVEISELKEANLWFNEEMSSLSKILNETIFIFSVDHKLDKRFRDFHDNFVVMFSINEFNTEAVISLSGSNIEFIHSITLIETSKNHSFQLLDSFVDKSLNYKIKYCFIFSCSNDLFSNDSNLNINQLIKEFKNAKLQFKCVLLAHFNQIEIEFDNNNYSLEGFSHKQRSIYNLPLDLLYIYALFFVNSMSEIEEFKERCNDLKSILKKIDQLWKLGNQEHEYNTNEKKKAALEKRMREYLGDLSNDLFNEKVKTPFNDKHVNLADYTKIENVGDLIKNILPTCFELFCLQVSRKNFHKTFSTKYFVKEMTITMTALLSPLLILSPFPIYLSLTYLPLFVVDSYVMGSAVGYSVFLHFLRWLHSQSTYKNTLEKYKQIPDIKYDGCFEAAIKKAIDEKRLKNDETDVILQTILLNLEIREILSKDFLFGVVGKSKCGKSTFTAKLTDQDTNASSTVPTTKMKSYKLTKSIFLLDYPHYDSLDVKHKLQFAFSRFLLDHAFMLCNSMEKVDSDNTFQLFKQINCAVGNNFTIFMNRADDLLKDCYSDGDFRKDEMEKAKKVVSDRIKKFTGKDYTKNIFLTCLSHKDSKGRDDMEMVDVLNKLEILTDDKLKLSAYEIIARKVREEDCKDIKNKIEEIKDNISKKLTNMHKKIFLKNEKGKAQVCIITKDIRNYQPDEDCDDDIIDSMDALIELWNSKTIPKFSCGNQIIENFDQFFTVPEVTFTVK